MKGLGDWEKGFMGIEVLGLVQRIAKYKQSFYLLLLPTSVNPYNEIKAQPEDHK